MAKPRLPVNVKQDILALTELGLGAEEIRAELLRQRVAGDRDYTPALRSIYNVRAAYRAADGEQDQPVDLLHPEEIGLPIEAAAVLMDHVAAMADVDYGGRRTRPLSARVGLSKRIARWLWWVHHAMAGVNHPRIRFEFARYLAAAEQTQAVFGDFMPTEWIHDLAAYRPWLDKEHKARYESALEQGLAEPRPDEWKITYAGLIGKSAQWVKTGDTERFDWLDSLLSSDAATERATADS